MTANDPRPANRLAGTTSPYLLQHAHNPVDWYPGARRRWQRARAEDKPILLSIGYSACHWCHVMERESFENDEHRRADERALRLRQGGPRGAARPRRHLHGRHAGHEPRAGRLADDGVPHAGAGAVLRGHLFPARRPLRPARLPHAARRASPTLWKDDRQRLRAQAAELVAAPARRARGPRPAGRVGRAAAAQARSRSSARDFDERWGGFGRAPKFPPSGALSAAAARATGASATSRRWRWRARRWTRWRAAACTTRSAAASTATRWTSAGWCRTSRRCCTTTRCSRASTSRASRSRGEPVLRAGRRARSSTTCCAR